MTDVDVAALKEARVELLVLFGSRARDRGREGSDVDLGVVLGPGEPSLERLDAVRGAIRADVEPDLVVLDRADPLLLYEVARDGRPVYESASGAFERFRVRAVKRYMDTAWIRRLEAEALRARYG